MKKLRGRAKVIYSNAANIITRAVKTTFLSMFLRFCKAQQRTEQLMESFNLFELKILGYYLRVLRSSREFLLPPLLLAELCLGTNTIACARLSDSIVGTY